MNYNIPQHLEPQIQRVAQAQHISEGELLDRIFSAGLERYTATPSANVPSTFRSYASFFGSIKGPGAHGSKEGIDKYLEELRNEW